MEGRVKTLAAKKRKAVLGRSGNRAVDSELVCGRCDSRACLEGELLCWEARGAGHVSRDEWEHGVRRP